MYSECKYDRAAMPKYRSNIRRYTQLHVIPTKEQYNSTLTLAVSARVEFLTLTTPSCLG